MTDESLLIIFTKNPISGLVKTRLANAIGDEAALSVYETLRHHTACTAEKVNVSRTVFYSHFLPATDIFLTDKYKAQQQAGDNLGERMLHAMRKGFETGFRHIVLIGTDCYELSATVLESAFAALEDADAVIGPASDGGFYLIGLNRLIPEIFLGREWSTKKVFGETIEILRRFDITPVQLPELSDIDTFDDLKKSGLWKHEA